MNLNDFLSLSDTEKNTVFGTVNNSSSKTRKFTGRKFTLIAYRNGETETFENVGANRKNSLKAELKADGYNRVDVIETATVVNETVRGERKARRMEFTKQAFAAANNKFQPEIMHEVKKNSQKTFPWEVITKGEDAWLDNRPIIKVADRNAKVRAERKRSEIFNRINSRNNSVESMKVYDRTSKLLFTSYNEEEIVKYMVNNNLYMEDVVLYVPSNIYNMLKGME